MLHNKLIVIVGPTASGKSKMAVKLAKKFSGEIISADSRTIYKEMDIGTAKPLQNKKLKIKNKKHKLKFKNNEIQKPLIVQKIPHYLIDIIKPDQQFNAALFKRRALKIIKGIQERGKIPFLVGGTGLYVSSIVDNLKIPEVQPDYRLRKKMEKLSKEILWQKLLKLDKNAALIIDKNNPRRIIRAIEICQTTKKSLVEQRVKGKPLFEILQIGLKLPLTTLYQRINKRVEQMFKQGLVKEVEKLYKKYGPQAPGLNCIGYKEIIPALKKEICFEEAKKLIKRNTRRYAKRQIQWFSAHGGSAIASSEGGKKDKRIVWLKNFKQAEKITKSFLKSP